METVIYIPVGSFSTPNFSLIDEGGRLTGRYGPIKTAPFMHAFISKVLFTGAGRKVQGVD